MLRGADRRRLDVLRRGVEACKEQVFATDAAQHSQPGDGVGCQLLRLAEARTLVALAPLQRSHQRCDRERQQRDADQNDEPEQ